MWLYAYRTQENQMEKKTLETIKTKLNACYNASAISEVAALYKNSRSENVVPFVCVYVCEMDEMIIAKQLMYSSEILRDFYFMYCFYYIIPKKFFLKWACIFI